jgi:hypothetical protein
MSAALTGAPRADEAPAEADDDAPRALEAAFQVRNCGVSLQPACAHGALVPKPAGRPLTRVWVPFAAELARCGCAAGVAGGGGGGAHDC